MTAWEPKPSPTVEQSEAAVRRIFDLFREIEAEGLHVAGHWSGSIGVGDPKNWRETWAGLEFDDYSYGAWRLGEETIP